MKGRAKDVRYITMPVRRGNLTAMVQATGTINPLTTVPVGSFVSGTVQYVFADFNTKVHAGDVLAQLDPTIYEAQVLTARGNLANAIANVENTAASIVADQANVDKLKATAEYAKVNARRISDLTKQGVISDDQNDQTQSNFAAANASVVQAEAQVDQTKAQLAEAKAQVESAQGNLQMAETNLEYCTIVSPVDGTVVARNVTVGQSVAASLQAPNVFTIAQDLTRMQVYAATDESDTGQIHVGQPATFQVDAYPTETFHGRVSAIRLNAFTVQNVVTYDTIIDFENPDGKTAAGRDGLCGGPHRPSEQCADGSKYRADLHTADAGSGASGALSKVQHPAASDGLASRRMADRLEAGREPKAHAYRYQNGPDRLHQYASSRRRHPRG